MRKRKRKKNRLQSLSPFNDTSTTLIHSFDT
jgi:hypothetical protein